MEFRAIIFKAFEKTLRASGMMRLFFSSRQHLRERTVNLSLNHFNSDDFQCAITRDYLLLDREGKKRVFCQTIDEDDLDKYSEMNRKFWRLKWIIEDPKDFWEVARGWQWLPAVAAAKSDREKREIIESIERWFSIHRYPNGLAWAVGLDVAIRGINLLLICELTGCTCLSSLLELHKIYLERMLWVSKGSARNNHYLGELVGLAMLKKSFQEDVSSLIKEIEKEINHQFYSDGVNQEQSVRYHKFSLEFALLANLYLGIEAPIIEKAGEFLLALRRPDGSWPSIGDDDLGCVLRLHNDELNGDYRAVLSVLSLIYNRSDFKKAADHLSAEAEMLVENATDKWNILESREPKNIYLFDKGGYFIYRTGWNRNDSYFLVKFGPHRWHAHADLFHVELCIDGDCVLTDSGTYRYWYKFGKVAIPELRRYFRSTAAHNAATINDKDQTEQWTTFRWHNSAKVTDWRIQETDGGFEFNGIHDGYERFGIQSERKISCSSDLTIVMIEDSFKGERSGEINLFWHFDPRISLEKVDERTIALKRDSKYKGEIKIKCNNPYRSEIVETPYSEYYSKLSNKKTLVILADKESIQDLEIKTEFQFK